MSNQTRSPAPSSRRGNPARTGTEQPTDALFDVLSSHHRRCVLSQLARHRTETSVTDLARRVAADEADCPVAEVSDDDHDRVECALFHVHLPKMADLGFVEYDPEQATVAPGVRTDDATPFIKISTLE